MFRWLTKRLRPYPVGTFGGDLIEELVPGHRARMARLDERREEEKGRQAKEVREQERYERERALRDPFWARRESERKREVLELNLRDAEWILDYEKRLAKLQKKLWRADPRPSKLGPTPSACGNWSTTSQGSVATSPSTSVLVLSV